MVVTRLPLRGVLTVVRVQVVGGDRPVPDEWLSRIASGEAGGKEAEGREAEGREAEFLGRMSAEEGSEERHTTACDAGADFGAANQESKMVENILQLTF